MATTSKTCGDIALVEKQTACDGCEFVDVALNLAIRAETRTITMRHDHCPIECPASPVKFESRRTATRSGQFTKNDCPAGKVGNVVTYYKTSTVLTSSAISQADADTQAQAQADAAASADITANGQAYANAVGSCK
jgi:Family of unknown function (DUF5977)